MMKNEHYHNTKLSEKELPFKTPEGYFETFPDRMMGRLSLEEEEKHPPSGRVLVLRYLRPVLALAASFALIFMLVYYPVKKFSPSLAENSVNELEHDLLNYYFTDDVFIKLFTDDEPPADDYDETSIETVLLASMSDYDLLHIKNE